MIHLDLDILADLLVGEGTPEAERHLTRCASCAARLGELDAVQVPLRAALAQLPVGGRRPAMPVDVAQRLDSALRGVGLDLPDAPADPAAPGPAGSAAPPVDSPPGAPDPPAPVPVPVTTLPARPSGAPRRWVPYAAAAALVGVLGWAGVTLLGRHSGIQTNATSALSARAAGGVAGLARNNTNLDYRRDNSLLVRELRPLLAGSATGPALVRDARPQAGSAPLAGSAGQAVAPGAATGGTSGAATGATIDPLVRLREPTGLASCLQALLPPGDERVLALDYARFEGRPALVVLLPSSVPHRVDVFVVGPDCSQADDKLVFFTRLPLP